MTDPQIADAETKEQPIQDQQTQSVDEVQKLKEALARATADYQNLSKRVEGERLEMAAYFTENFAKKLLPTLDNLDRLVSGTPPELQTGAVYEGVKNANIGLAKVLESMGVKPFVSVGAELDPHFHDALSQGPGPAGVVTAELEKGYSLGEKVIRHAKVVVGSGEELPV